MRLLFRKRRNVCCRGGVSPTSRCRSENSLCAKCNIIVINGEALLYVQVSLTSQFSIVEELQHSNAPFKARCDQVLQYASLGSLMKVMHPYPGSAGCLKGQSLILGRGSAFNKQDLVKSSEEIGADKAARKHKRGWSIQIVLRWKACT